MVIETNSYPGSYKRIYYGLKQNGRPLFINKTNGEETTYYSVTVENEEKKGKYESGSLVIKESTTGKEFYCSVSKLDCYSEILDFENEGIYYKRTTSFASEIMVYSLHHSLIPF